MLRIWHVTRCCFTGLLLSTASMGVADDGIVVNRQKVFPKSIPAGDYSGIAWLGGDKYAVVSDKSENEGYYIFTIKTDSLSGKIVDAKSDRFVECAKGNRDLEGIAWLADKGWIVMCGEKDNRIRAYHEDGKAVGIDIAQHKAHRMLPGNGGLESLSYNAVTKRLWACNETAPITLVEYDADMNVHASYQYVMDKAEKHGDKAFAYVHGVSEVCAMDDGSLLVLEREFHVPKLKMGSSVVCKLYRYSPLTQTKTLVTKWKTRLNLLSRTIANYEGMCLGPQLADGRRIIVMVADSQSRYKGVLKDWFKTICIKTNQINVE